MAANKSDRLKKIEKLEKKFFAEVSRRRERLELERKLLQMVLDTQGFKATSRRSANMDKLKGLATAKELLQGTSLTP